MGRCGSRFWTKRASSRAPATRTRSTACCSLGIPGEFDHPKFVEAIDAVIEAGRATDTSLGRLVPDVDTGIALYRQGFDFIAYSADAWALGDAVASGLTAIRTGCAD